MLNFYHSLYDDGGDIDTTNPYNEGFNELFGEITNSQITLGDTLYKKLFLKNDGSEDVNNLMIFFGRYRFEADIRFALMEQGSNTERIGDFTPDNRRKFGTSLIYGNGYTNTDKKFMVKDVSLGWFTPADIFQANDMAVVFDNDTGTPKTYCEVTGVEETTYNSETVWKVATNTDYGSNTFLNKYLVSAINVGNLASGAYIGFWIEMKIKANATIPTEKYDWFNIAVGYE